MSAAAELLKPLGTPRELRALAERSWSPSRRPGVNSHVHLPPNFSAFDSVEQAVERAACEGVRVLGASNYYDYAVYEDFARQARRRGVFPLFGTEIIALDADLAARGIRVNDPKNAGRIYLCGKGITRFADLTSEAQRILDLIRQRDSTRMTEMVDKIEVHFANHGFGTELSEAEVVDSVTRRHGVPRETVYLQERHAAQAFQEWLFANVQPGERLDALRLLLGAEPGLDPGDHVAVQNALRDQLMKAGRPAYVDETFVDFSQAKRLILEMDGIPCYPTLADGAAQACEFETPVDKLLQELDERGIHAAEFVSPRNTPEALSRYVHAMRDHGLIITDGTEHNTLSLDPMEPGCAGGQPVPEDVRQVFWEGACVVAAHQFLRVHGEPGYVDREGRLGPDYSDREHRIAAFRRLGAAVIESYLGPG